LTIRHGSISIHYTDDFNGAINIKNHQSEYWRACASRLNQACCLSTVLFTLTLGVFLRNT
jgi:hypothetical protein